MLTHKIFSQSKESLFQELKMLGKFEWNANSNKACMVYIQYKCIVYICIPLVEEVLAQKLQVDSYGEIVKLAKGGYCWKEHLYHLESVLSPSPWDHHLCYLHWLGRLDSGGYTVCAQGAPLIPEEAAPARAMAESLGWGHGSCQWDSWLHLCPYQLLPWWALNLRGYLEHGLCHLGPVPMPPANPLDQ